MHAQWLGPPPISEPAGFVPHAYWYRTFSLKSPMDGLRGPGTLRDVTIATTMSTLVGLELWTDQIGPQTTEQVDGMEGAVGFDAIGWAGGRALLVCSMIHPSAFLDAITTEIPLPTRPKPSSRPISVVIEMVEPGAFGDGFSLPRVTVDTSSNDPFRRQSHPCRVRGSSNDAMRRGHRPWARKAAAIQRGLCVLGGVGRGGRGVSYSPRYMSEWCGQSSAAIGLLPIEKPSRECKCCDEEIVMARVPKRARPALIKRDRVSISRAFRKASAGRNRCTEQRARHRRWDGL